MTLVETILHAWDCTSSKPFGHEIALIKRDFSSSGCVVMDYGSAFAFSKP